jgi:hypothetical protein
MNDSSCNRAAAEVRIFRQLASMKLSSDVGLVCGPIPDHHQHFYRREAQVELANFMEQANR